MIRDRLDLPAIATVRLKLRALRRADAADLRAMTDEPSTLAAVHILPEPFGLGEAEALIAGADGVRDTFFGGRLADERLAVVCGAHLSGEDAVEVGYWCGAAFRGQGIAFEATAAFVAAIRAALPYRGIVAECRRENEASWRLLHKLGFQATGEAGARPGRLRLFL